MKSLRGSIFALSIIVLLCLSWMGSSLANDNSRTNVRTDQQSDSLYFRWALVGATPQKKGWKIFSVTKDTTMRSGDHLMVYFEPETPCYVYLFLHDSQGNIDLLLPSSKEQLGTPLQTTERYLVPSSGSSMKLDENIGEETFYLIVSSERLESLESTYGEMQISHAETTIDYKRKFLNEVRSIFRRASGMYGDVAEIPPRIAGTLRGVGTELEKSLSKIDFEKYTIDITRENLYTKKIVIKHR